MKQSATFSTCPHAHVVYNKYTGEPVVVPCGKCVFCRMAKGAILASRLNLESSYHPYNLFFTLTYDNDHIPLAYRLDDFLALNGDISSSDICLVRDSYYDIYRDTPMDEIYVVPEEDSYRFLDFDGYLGADVLPPVPANHDELNCFGVLRKSDVQKFIKRLRHYVTTDPSNLYPHISKEARKIRYYVCGEYGPVTFRPHYHGLLFCDSKEIAQAILSEYIYKAWQMCDKKRIDVQYVSKTASSYVSSYVSSYLDMPRILANGYARPFYLASKAPALGVCQSKAKDVFEKVSQGSVTEILHIIDQRTKVPVDIVRKLPLQVTRYLFPKCVNFAGLRKNVAALTAIYFPFLSKVPREYLKQSKWHYEYERLNIDGSVGWYNVVNITCYHRAVDVSNQFGLTPLEYIDLLLSFYSKSDLYSYSKQYQAVEDWSKSVPFDQVKRCIFASTTADIDTIYTCLPKDIYPSDLEYKFDVSMFKDISSALKVWQESLDVNPSLASQISSLNSKGFSFHVKPFEKIPSSVRELFHVDVCVLLACYDEDTDGVYHLRLDWLKNYYAPERNSLIIKERSEVISSYQGVLTRKRHHQDPRICGELNRKVLD